MASLDLSITVGADDGVWSPGGAAFSAASASGNAGNTFGGSGSVFLFFRNVTIPQGSTIDAATLTVTPVANVIATANLKVAGNDVDDATAPTSASEADNAARTTAQVDWDQAGTTSGTPVTSPDISTVLQEIVNRAGWASGNDLGLFLDDDGSGFNGRIAVAMLEHTTEDPASLSITYTEPAAGGGLSIPVAMHHRKMMGVS